MNYIKLDLQEGGWGDLHWIVLAQERGRQWDPVNDIRKLRVS
jgi:hypothetical protein